MERGVLDGRTHKTGGKQGAGPESNLQRVFRKSRLQDLFGDSHKIYSPIIFSHVVLFHPRFQQRHRNSSLDHAICLKRGRSTPLPSFSGSQNAALEEIPCRPEAIPSTSSLEQTLVLSWWGAPWTNRIRSYAYTGPGEMAFFFLKHSMLIAEKAVLFRNCSKMVSNSQEVDVQVYLMGEVAFVWDWVSDQWLSFKAVEFKPSKLHGESWGEMDAGRRQDGYREELSSHLICGWVEQTHGVLG